LKVTPKDVHEAELGLKPFAGYFAQMLSYRNPSTPYAVPKANQPDEHQEMNSKEHDFGIEALRSALKLFLEVNAGYHGVVTLVRL